MATVLTVAFGVLLLVVLLLPLLGRLRRFARATDALRGGMARGLAGIPALRARR